MAPPPNAAVTCPRCDRQIGDTGDIPGPLLDATAAALLLALIPAVTASQREILAAPFAVAEAYLRGHLFDEVRPGAGRCRGVAELLASHADAGMFADAHTKADRRACDTVFDALARGLATLSFLPGGVDFCGAHWCACHPDSRSRVRQYRELAP